MTTQLTEQERLFLDRVAIELVKRGLPLDDASINAAAAAVTARDRQLAALLVCKLKDQAAPLFADRAWQAMQPPDDDREAPPAD